LSAVFGRDKTNDPFRVINTLTGAVATNSVTTFSNSSHIFELGAEGPLFTLPAGDARLAVGAGYRYTGLVIQGITSNRTIVDGDESSRFGYAELSVPVISPEQKIRGIERLELTGAIRAEDSGAYGSVATPKFGLVYSPATDFTLKASWGKSFKAPRLMQRYFGQNVDYYPVAATGGTGYPADSTVLYRIGGNKDLSPERARTWSTSLAFHPEAVPGLESELTWFDIDFTDRVVQPVILTDALANPMYAGFVAYRPTPEALADVVNNASRFYNYAGAPYDASKVVAIIDGRYVNASTQKVRGVDLSASYRIDLGTGRLTLRGSASWLDSKQATLPTQSPFQLAGTLFYPAKLSARIGAVWDQGRFTASVFGSYKGGVRNVTAGTKGASYTAFDATIRYRTDDAAGAMANVAVELSAQNLLDRSPPLYAVTALYEAPYDSTNYSAVGRFLSLSVSKHW
jgi:outer membrane receptor protein involved in Fe transport